MVISTPVAYAILAAVGLLALVGFVIVFMRLGREPKPLGSRRRAPSPVGWPIAPATPPNAEPVEPHAASPRP
jgi:hypothetical protein